jgi:hypothetical protein
VRNPCGLFETRSQSVAASCLPVRVNDVTL